GGRAGGGREEWWAGGGETGAGGRGRGLGRRWGGEMAAAERLDGGDEVQGGNAILSRWPILADAAARLPTAGADEGRVAVHARVEAPGGVLPMFTTHLTHHPGASAIRLAQVRRLAGFIANHVADCAYPPAVTSRLNAEPASDELRLLGGSLTAPVVPGQVLVDA